MRQRAQEALSQVVKGLPPFTYAIRSVVMELPKYLKEGPEVTHEQFKVGTPSSSTHMNTHVTKHTQSTQISLIIVSSFICLIVATLSGAALPI